MTARCLAAVRPRKALLASFSGHLAAGSHPGWGLGHSPRARGDQVPGPTEPRQLGVSPKTARDRDSPPRDPTWATRGPQQTGKVRLPPADRRGRPNACQGWAGTGQGLGRSGWSQTGPAGLAGSRRDRSGCLQARPADGRGSLEPDGWHLVRSPPLPLTSAARTPWGSECPWDSA